MDKRYCIKTVADPLYREAKALSARNAKAAAMDRMCRAFWVRAFSGDTDRAWADFFFTQFTMYLLLRGNPEVNLGEGDMVCDLIREVWEATAAPEFVDDESFRAWSSTVRIDFPVDPSRGRKIFFFG